MSVTVKELVTSWGFDVDDKPLMELDESLDVLKTSVRDAALLVAGLVGTLYGFVETTAKSAFEVSDLAQSLGTTTTALQKWQNISKIYNLDSANMEMALRKISTSAYEASMGGAQANLIFSQLGIDIYDTATGKIKPSTTIMSDIADAFHRMPDGVFKTAAATELLGYRTGTRMVPALNLGSAAMEKLGNELERYNAALTPEQIERGEKFAQMMNKMELIAIGLKKSVGEQLMPAISKFFEKALAWYNLNQDFINQGITNFLAVAATALENGANAAEMLVNGLKKLLVMTGAIDHLRFLFVAMAAAFGTITAGTVIATFLSLLPILSKLATALRVVMIGEAGATNGAALWTMGAAMVAAGAATAWMVHDPSSSGGFFGTKPQRGAGSSIPVSGQGGIGTVHQDIKIAVQTAPGTSTAQANDMVMQSKQLLDKHLRNAAATFATPTPTPFPANFG